MNWKEYQSKHGRYGGIAVYRRSLTITKPTFQKLGSPKSVALYFDKEAGAIRITDGDMFTVKFPQKNPRINCSISDVMPIGKYIASTDYGIFTLKP